jgi:hypothetical protein
MRFGIMKVANTRSTSLPGRTSPGGASTTESDGFARVLDGVSGGRQPTPASVSGVTAASGVLAVQEVPTATDGGARRKAVRRGEQLLDELERLRLAIVAGALEPERLVAAASLVRARIDGLDDPELADLVAEIELRVEVELAKWHR